MISIIILTLSEERSLPSLLDAICQQGADHEVIVVDGGSQDRTLEIARKFSSPESVHFINGVLDSIAKDLNAAN